MKKWYGIFGMVFLLGQFLFAQEVRTISPHVELSKVKQVENSSSHLRMGDWQRHLMPITPIDGTVLKTQSCDTIFKVDFQSGIPSTWLNKDLDGRTDDYGGRPNKWFLIVDDELTVPGDTNVAVASNSWFNTAAYSNNWLITDSFTVCDSNLYLVWKSKPFEGPAFMDGYFVLISKTDTQTSSFTDTLAKFAEGNASGNIVTPGIVHPNFNSSNRGLWVQWSFSLKPWYGQTIYIAFVHRSFDDNLIMLDDIMVVRLTGGPLTYVDARVNKVGSTSEYYFIPKKQVPTTSVRAKATIRNIGNANANNVKVHFSVYEGATLLWKDTVTVATLNAFSSQTVTSNKSFGVSNVSGTTYSVAVEVVAPGDTIFTLNNRDSAQVIQVTDSIYSRDNNLLTGVLSIGAGSDGIMGQNYTYLNTDEVVGVLFRINPSNTLGYTFITLWDVTGTGQPQNLLTVTDTFFIIDTTAQWYILPFKVPQSFTGSKTFYVGAYENSAGVLRLGTSDDIFTPQRTWVFFSGNWRNNEFYGINQVYALRLLSRTTVTSVDNAFNLGTLILYPNPAKDYLFISLTTQEQITGTVTIYDLKGQEVLSQPITLGNYRAIPVPIASLSGGLYVVKIQTEKGTVTRKIQIE
jgi:hypothetical protein